MSKQISLDLSASYKGFDPGKKTERISFTGSADMKDFLDRFAHKRGLTVSELCQRYVIEGLQADIGKSLLIDVNSHKTLDQLLR